MINGRNPLPIRSCLKKTGPGLSSLIKIDIATKKGDKIAKPIPEHRRSKKRFIVENGKDA